MTGSVEVVELSEGKNLAKIMSSDTAKQIIELVEKKEECTASDLAKELKLPASTVHYNLKALVQAKILDDSHFTYSSKGKTVVHYRLANKVIILVPQKEGKSSMVSQLKAILPGLFGVVALAGVALFANMFRGSNKSFNAGSAPLADAAVQETELLLADALPRAAAAPKETQEVITAAGSAVSSSSGFLSSQLAIGLLIGAGIIVVGAIIYIFIRQRKQRTISE